jgi:hypothetical protein|tara:strand:+ start:446 stop:565 length:120 start_codon:yes stop_codon:yes gene_type:complete
VSSCKEKAFFYLAFSNSENQKKALKSETKDILLKGDNER